MSFDERKQNARADEILRNYLESEKITNLANNLVLREAIRHVYAIAYQEGWEDSRTRP